MGNLFNWLYNPVTDEIKVKAEEYYAAESMESATVQFMVDLGYEQTPEGVKSFNEDCSGMKITEISEENLNEWTVTGEEYSKWNDGNGFEKFKRTWREHLTVMQSRGDTFPCEFCSTLE